MAVVVANYPYALLEAFGNERFRQFVVDHMNEDDSERLEFCVEMVVYHIQRKNGRWRIGHYQIKDDCWWKVIKGEALIISV